MSIVWVVCFVGWILSFVWFVFRNAKKKNSLCQATFMLVFSAIMLPAK